MADKGGKVVILESNMYKKMVLEILEDHITERKFSFDPTSSFMTSLKKIIAEGVSIGAFSGRQGRFHCPQHPLHAISHGLPKVHFRNGFTK